MLSTTALLTAMVVGVFVFALGYTYKAFQGARAGYHTLKGTVPAARKGYFAALWKLVKWAIGALAIVAVLLTWAVNDAADADNPERSPSPSATRRR
jgi:hypothetical protein